MVDYLDIMADMERQFLMSPVKIDPSHPDMQREMSIENARVLSAKQAEGSVPLGIGKMEMIFGPKETLEGILIFQLF